MKHVETLKTAQILFLGEQDGAVERELKQALVACFEKDSKVVSAFLVRVSYRETPGINVAICIGTEVSPRPSECVIAAFRSRFSPMEKTDFIFLSQEQLNEIAKVARSFYVRE